jgi:hypothetical protein
VFGINNLLNISHLYAPLSSQFFFNSYGYWRQIVKKHQHK